MQGLVQTKVGESTKNDDWQFEQKYNKQRAWLKPSWVKILKMLIGSFRRKVWVQRTGSSFKCKRKHESGQSSPAGQGSNQGV